MQNSMPVRRVLSAARCVCAFGLLVSLAVGAAAAGEAFCSGGEAKRPELLRIEAAFAQGLDRAGDADARLRCFRLRNAGLAALVDRSYQSALAWLIEFPDFAAALEKDQAVWQDAVTAAMDAITEDMPALERISGSLLERLRLLDCLTGASFLQDFSSEL